MTGKDIERMRMVVSDAYPGMGWKARVAKMSNAQVVAIHKSIMARKVKFSHLGRNDPEEKNWQVVDGGLGYHQYNLFELGLEITK